MSTEYRLSEAYICSVTRRSLRLSVPVMMAAIAGGYYASGGHDSFVTAAVFLVGVIALMVVVILKTMQRQRAQFRTLRIVVDETAITRTQDGLPPFAIPLAEVTLIAEVPDQGLVIRGRGADQVLALPAGLENYDHARQRLATVRPIEPAKPVNSSVRVLAPTAAMIALIIVFYRAVSVVWVLSTGTVLVVALGACAVLIARSPHVDRRIKRGNWILAIPLASIMLRMWFVATHHL